MDRKELKKKRLETTYRETISEAILTKISDTRMLNEVISITRVKVSDDLAIAEVFFTVLNASARNRITKALFSAAPFFVSLIGDKLKIRMVPRIKFTYDSNQGEADQMLTLIEKLSKTGGKKLAD